MENIQKATGKASEIIGYFEELVNSKKYDAEKLIFVSSAVANLELVNRTQQFGGLDPVNNPCLFTGKLAYRCACRYSWEIWMDQRPKSKSETALRGYDTMDVLQGTGPYSNTVKPTHRTLVEIYAAHQARAHFGLDIPPFVGSDSLTWLEDILAKELAPEDLNRLEDRAWDIAERAAEYGKIKSQSELAVANYQKAVFDGLKKEQEAIRRISKNNMLHIADMMCDPAYLEEPVGVSEEEIQGLVAPQVVDFLGRIVKFLRESLERMEKLSRSTYGNLGNEANESAKAIQYALQYAYTDQYAAQLKQRRALAQSARAKFQKRH